MREAGLSAVLSRFLHRHARTTTDRLHREPTCRARQNSPCAARLSIFVFRVEHTATFRAELELLEETEADAKEEENQDARCERGLDVLHERLVERGGQRVARHLADGLHGDGNARKQECSAKNNRAAAKETLQQLLSLFRDA